MSHDPRRLRSWLGEAIHRQLGTITHVETQEPLVALTFDDGPHPTATPALLNLLERYGARATFFMIGMLAKRYPDIVREVAERGHTVGNHSWDHPSFPLVSGSERRAQIRACAEALAPYGQRLLRPPYGHQTTASRLDAFWLGYETVMYNRNAIDWDAREAASIVQRIGSRLSAGDIVIFHDGYFLPEQPEATDRRPTLEAVEAILDMFRHRYRFVTVPSLVRSGRPHRTPWHLVPDAKLVNELKSHPRHTEAAVRRYSAM